MAASDNPENIPEPPEPSRTTKTKKLIAGVLLVIGIAVSVCGAGQFAKSTYSVDPDRPFNAPFFITWFNACGLVICYPVYLLCMLINCRRTESWESIWLRSRSIYGSGRITVTTVLTHIGFFSLLGLATNYAYIRALGLLDPSNVTAVFAANPVFVFLLSCIFLGARTISLKLIAVALAVSGVVLISYSAQGFDTYILIGVSLTLLSALGAAVYTVLLKRIIGSATPAQVALFLSAVATFGALVFFPIVLIFHYSGAEEIIPANIPWHYMSGSCCLGIIFNFLINFGVAFTYPLFAAFGGIVAVPLNYLADATFRNVSFDMYKVIGAVLVMLAFIIIVTLPEKLDDRFYAKVTRRLSPPPPYSERKQDPEELQQLRKPDEI